MYLKMCVCVGVSVMCVHVFHISLHYFVASVAGLPGGCDTHSSASSHMKELGPLVAASEIPGCSSEEGRGERRGERRRDGEQREGVTGPLLQESHRDFLSIHL